MFYRARINESMPLLAHIPYIGLHSPVTRGSFQWEDGSPVIWTNWHSRKYYKIHSEATVVIVNLWDDWKFYKVNATYRLSAMCIYPGKCSYFKTNC